MRRRYRRSLVLKSNERGSAMVEFALTGIVFLSLLLAAADLGYTIFAKAMIRHGVREGARFATLGKTLGDMGHDDSIKKVTRDNSMGIIGAADLDKIQIQYYLPDGATAVSSNGPGNIVTVDVADYTHTPLGAVLRSNYPIRLDAKAIDVMEPYEWTPPGR